MFDPEFTRTVAASIIGATFLAGGGVVWKTNQDVNRHDEQLLSLSKTAAEIASMRDDVADIGRDVAVIKERTKVYADPDDPARN